MPTSTEPEQFIRFPFESIKLNILHNLRSFFSPLNPFYPAICFKFRFVGEKTHLTKEHFFWAKRKDQKQSAKQIDWSKSQKDKKSN